MNIIHIIDSLQKQTINCLLTKSIIRLRRFLVRSMLGLFHHLTVINLKKQMCELIPVKITYMTATFMRLGYINYSEFYTAQ